MQYAADALYNGNNLIKIANLPFNLSYLKLVPNPVRQSEMQKKNYKYISVSGEVNH